jgi:hypothetical protein
MIEGCKTGGLWPCSLRIAVGAHVAAACVCALLSILDSSSIGFPPEHALVRSALNLLLLPALLTWLVSPFTVLTVSLRRGLSRETLCALLAEFVICIAQVFLLLPLVQ